MKVLKVSVLTLASLYLFAKITYPFLHVYLRFNMKFVFFGSLGIG